MQDHYRLAGTKLYCLVTEAHVCEQHSYMKVEQPRLGGQDRVRGQGKGGSPIPLPPFFPSLHFPLPYPFPSSSPPLLIPSLPLEVDPLNTARSLGERCLGSLEVGDARV